MVELLFDVEEGVAVQSDMRVVNTGPAKSVGQVWSLAQQHWLQNSMFVISIHKQKVLLGPTLLVSQKGLKSMKSANL